MLQMRAGYPWEESMPELFELLHAGFPPSNPVDVPLAYDPGTRMEYNNLTSHLLAIPPHSKRQRGAYDVRHPGFLP
jgi:hypothetical protein